MGESGCPCGNEAYATCCGPIHETGAGLGATAEQLMRARYSAYALGKGPFILSSWHPDTRPDRVAIDPSVTWHDLEIISTEAGTAFDNHGVVEFLARFDRAGTPLELHERSTFTRLDGRWVYVDGE